MFSLCIISTILVASTLIFRYMDDLINLRASSPVRASETGLAKTQVLARLTSLVQIGELARRLRFN